MYWIHSKSWKHDFIESLEIIKINNNSNKYQWVFVDLWNTHVQLRHFPRQSSGKHFQVVTLSVAVVGQYDCYVVVHSVQHVVMWHLASQIQISFDTTQQWSARTGNGRSWADCWFCNGMQLQCKTIMLKIKTIRKHFLLLNIIIKTVVMNELIIKCWWFTILFDCIIVQSLVGRTTPTYKV